MRFKLSKLILILFFFSFIFLVKANAASAASFSLSPASGSVQVGSTISVDVKLNTGASQIKNGALAISYPADKLEAIVQSNGELFDSNGSPFSFSMGVCVDSSGVDRCPAGSIAFSFIKTAAPFPSGTNLQLARLTFKAKLGSGTADITFKTLPLTSGGTTDNGLVDTTGVLLTPTLSGGSYTLTGTVTNPPSNPPPTNNPPASTPTTSTKPTTSTTPKPTSYVATPTTTTGDKTAPKISNVTVSDITINSAKISWTTDEASNSIVEYSQTNEYLISQNLSISEQSATLTTSHSVTLPSSILQIGYGYTFRVRSIDGSGNSAQSDIATFRTKGYTVRLKIVDKDTGDPLTNVSVIFTNEKITKTTDNDGVVIFDDIANMDHPLKVSYSGKVYLDTIVKITGESGVGSANAQTVEVKVAGIAQLKQNFRYIGWAMILVGLAALAGVVVVWLKNRNKNPAF